LHQTNGPHQVKQMSGVYTQHKKTEHKSLKTQWRHSRYNCIIPSQHHVVKTPCMHYSWTTRNSSLYNAEISYYTWETQRNVWRFLITASALIVIVSQSRLLVGRCSHIRRVRKRRSAIFCTVRYCH